MIVNLNTIVPDGLICLEDIAEKKKNRIRREQEWKKVHG
jgi:hypothetical protein